MDVALSTTCFDAEAVKRINYCRLFLQAVTLSDITLPDRLGNQIDPSLMTGPNSKCPKSTYCPTKQARPTASSWKTWQQFCAILEDQLHWQSYFDHATHLLYYRDDSTDKFFQLHHTDGTKRALRTWEISGCAKIALKCPTQDELELIAARAMERDIPIYLVEDAGRTQIAAGSRTVLGLGPAPTHVFDGVTSHLKLM
eukprot:scaffold1634_cov95-Cylindrotheca_fusiformis.AAC.5